MTALTTNARVLIMGGLKGITFPITDEDLESMIDNLDEVRPERNMNQAVAPVLADYRHFRRLTIFRKHIAHHRKYAA